MTDEADESTREDVEETPTKDSDHPDPIDAGKAQTGTGTATGQEALRRAGHEDDRISSLESRGGQGTEDEVRADFLHRGAGNVGLQNEVAEFTSNGTVPSNTVPSPSGLVPVAALATSPAQAEQLMKDRQKELKASRRKPVMQRMQLTEAQVGSMGRAELNAVAHDRGYKFSNGMGTRSTRAAFLEAQAEDKYIIENRPVED